GNVQVTWDTTSTANAPRYNVVFTGSLAGVDAAPITASGTALSYASVQTRTLTPGTPAVNEQQTVTINSGSATGTFRLAITVNSRTYTTADLAFNATASSIQTALNTALGTAGTVAVTRPGTAGSSTFDITFSGALTGKDLSLLKVYTDVVTPTAGGSFTLSYAGQTTAAISLAGSTALQASQIQQALQALTSIGTGNISVKYDTTSTNADTAPRFLLTSGTISVENITASGTNLTNGASVATNTTAGTSTTVNEVQTIKLETGTATGTFSIALAFNGNTYQTAALPFDATAAAIQSALNTAISAVGSAAVARSGTAGSATLTITFGGGLGGKNLDPLTVTTSTVTPTAGGSFTLTYGGQTTRPINLVTGNSVQATLIQLELQRLPNIGSGNVDVTWDSTSAAQQPRYRVALQGALASTVASTFTAQGAGLTNAAITTAALTTGKAIVSEKQRIVINTGTETGTYRLVVPVGSSAYQTQALSFTAAASEIQTALYSALASIEASTTVEASTSSGQLTLDITFGGKLTGTDLAATRVLTQADAPAPSGVFTLSYNGNTTGNITYSADTQAQASAIQSALRSLPGLGTDSVSVAYDNASAPGTAKYLITFSGQQARSNVPQISADFPSLSCASITTGTKIPGIASRGETQRVRVLTSGNSSSFTLTVPFSGTNFTTAAISTSAGKDAVQTALKNAIATASGATITVLY
ncbi:MAG: beta strand repeat-containing protein, partial [Planctomyces sp.]